MLYLSTVNFEWAVIITSSVASTSPWKNEKMAVKVCELKWSQFRQRELHLYGNHMPVDSVNFLCVAGKHSLATFLTGWPTTVVKMSSGWCWWTSFLHQITQCFTYFNKLQRLFINTFLHFVSLLSSATYSEFYVSVSPHLYKGSQHQQHWTSYAQVDSNIISYLHISWENKTQSPVNNAFVTCDELHCFAKYETYSVCIKRAKYNYSYLNRFSWRLTCL